MRLFSPTPWIARCAWGRQWGGRLRSWGMRERLALESPHSWPPLLRRHRNPAPPCLLGGRPPPSLPMGIHTFPSAARLLATFLRGNPADRRVRRTTLRNRDMKHFITPLSLGLGMALATAAGLAQAQVTVQDAWVRATVPQQKATGAFMRLQSSKDTRLVSVSTPAAPVAEVHEMKMVDNVMKMRAVPGLPLPAGQPVELSPGGFHVMLMDLPAQVKQGDTVPLTLVFEGKDGQRETVQVQAQARGVGAGAAAAAPGNAPHGGAHKH